MQEKTQLFANIYILLNCGQYNGAFVFLQWWPLRRSLFTPLGVSVRPVKRTGMHPNHSPHVYGLQLR